MVYREVIRGNNIFLPSELETDAVAPVEGATGGLGTLSTNGGSAGNLEGKADTWEGDLAVRCEDPAESTWQPEPEGGLRPCTIRGGPVKPGGVAIRGGVDTTAVAGSVAGPGADTEGAEATGEAPESRGGVEAVAGAPEGRDNMEPGEAFTAGSRMEAAMSGHWAADCSVCWMYSWGKGGLGWTPSLWGNLWPPVAFSIPLYPASPSW